MKNRNNNISKVKYYLPKRNEKGLYDNQRRLSYSSKADKIIRKQPQFDILNIQNITEEQKENVKHNLLDTLPEKQRENFKKFVVSLENDQEYQKTITMFTVMYFLKKNNFK